MITIDIMAEYLPAEVVFHYSDYDHQITNVNRITVLFDNYQPVDLTVLYHTNDEIQAKINEELIDLVERGDYE